MAKTLTIQGTQTTVTSHGPVDYSAVAPQFDLVAGDGDPSAAQAIIRVANPQVSGQAHKFRGTIQLLDKDDNIVESVASNAAPGAILASLILDTTAGVAAQVSDNGQDATWRVDAATFATGKIVCLMRGVANAAEIRAGTGNLGGELLDAYNEIEAHRGSYEITIPFTVSEA